MLATSADALRSDVLRHPSFVALRTDKPARRVRHELT
jgi:ATP-dependent DNA ligase